MKVVIDNVACLGVEQCLMRNLPNLFTPDSVVDLDEETIRNIASEPPGLTIKRKKLQKKKQSLLEGLQILDGSVSKNSSNVSSLLSLD